MLFVLLVMVNENRKEIITKLTVTFSNDLFAVFLFNKFTICNLWSFNSDTN